MHPTWLRAAELHVLVADSDQTARFVRALPTPTRALHVFAAAHKPYIRARKA